MNESKSPVLDAFADEFGNDIVFSNKSFNIADENIDKIYKTLNASIFENRLENIPIKYMTYDEICQFSARIYNKYRKSNDAKYVKPPESIYGMHSAVILNDIFKYEEPLIFAKEELIYLNASRLKAVSFTLCVSTLCHEMIHYYDRLYGEYQNRYKAFLISGADPHLHDTPTFERKMK